MARRPIQQALPAISPTLYDLGIREDIVRGEWMEDSYRYFSAFAVLATRRDTGRRFYYAGPVPTSTRQECQKLIDRIQAHIDAGRPFDPESAHGARSSPISSPNASTITSATT
jgi:hypothetical protein